MRSIVWFREIDLRLSDHEPLRQALDVGETIPLFLLDPYTFAPDQAQQAPHGTQFLLDSLEELAESIEKKGSRLILVEGDPVEQLPRLADKWKVDRVLAHRRVEPFQRERGKQIAEALGDRLELFDGHTLAPPRALRTGGGKPYSVFTPFAKAFRESIEVGKALPAPRELPPLPDDVKHRSVKLPSCESLGIERNDRIQAGGESQAHRRAKRFLEERASDYADMRDRMDVEGTSRLSADLKFGTLSARQLWNAVKRDLGRKKAAQVYSNEILWREFSYSTLFDRPELVEEPFRADFADFPWRDEEEPWSAWVEGRTGYPVVDASARQLLATGFVHNRARMISASFLTKHLLQDYARGEAHYMKYLTDGDLAQNNAGWQWSAGCGCDAQPYFRVFNPTLQGEKFDPEGDYVREWVPELRKLPKKYIHEPWAAPKGVLEEAGIELGEDYPEPIVEHKKARERFLETAKKHLKS